MTTAPDTLEDLLIALAEKDLRIRILSEREVRVMAHLPEPTKWQWWCELQHPNGWRDADWGGSMFTAIANAFERAKGNRGPDNRPMDNTVLAPVQKTAQTTVQKTVQPEPEPEIDMDDLIGGTVGFAEKKKTANQIDMDDLI